MVAPMRRIWTWSFARPSGVPASSGDFSILPGEGSGKRIFNLNQVIEETVRFVDRSASLQHIEITSDLDPDLPQIWGDADLIKQVILNMLINAEQAIVGKGNILVESRRYVDKATLHPVLNPCRWLK